MAEESGDLRGIGPQHPQALNALIGNPEVPQKNSDPTPDPGRRLHQISSIWPGEADRAI